MNQFPRPQMQEIGGVDVSGYVGSDEEFTEVYVRQLREWYATGWITLAELELNLERVLCGGSPIEPRRNGQLPPGPDRLVRR